MGILFVVIYHATTYKYSWLYSSSAIYTFRYYMRTFLSAGVPIFFFCNGYLLLNRRFCLKKHVFKIVKIIALTGIWDMI